MWATERGKEKNMKRKIKMLLNFAIATAVMISCMTIQGFAVSEENESNIEGKIYVDGVDITVDVEEEITRAIEGITDLQIPDSKSPIAVVSGELDEQCLIETYTTTRMIQAPYNNAYMAGENEPIYATTSVAVLSKDKSDSGSKNKNYVTAYATVYWRDNLGIGNEFLGASGGWDLDTDPSTGRKPSLSNRRVTLEAYLDASNYVDDTFTPSGNTFEYSEDDFDYMGFILSVDTSVKINSDSTLTLHVASGLLT